VELHAAASLSDTGALRACYRITLEAQRGHIAVASIFRNASVEVRSACDVTQSQGCVRIVSVDGSLEAHQLSAKSISVVSGSELKRSSNVKNTGNAKIVVRGACLHG